MRDALEGGAEDVALFEDTVVDLVQKQQLGYVCASLYMEAPTDDGLVPQFCYNSVDYLRRDFPRLKELGVLRV